MLVPNLPRQFNTAFDLSSLKAPAPIAAGGVIEANERIFVEELIPLSKSTPIILLLSSPRSEDSLALAKILTALAQASAGAWQLATVNADSEPEIVQALRATGVPTTLAIIGGQVAPLFEGILPLEQLAELLKKVMELAFKQGVGQSGGQSELGLGDENIAEPELLAAYEGLTQKNLAQAKSEFGKLLSRIPGNKDALMGLAHIELLERISGLDSQSTLERAKKTSILLNPAGASGVEVDLKLHAAAADFQFLAGDISGALKNLIELIKITAGGERDLLRLQVLSLFGMLGNDDPELISARGALARALF